MITSVPSIPKKPEATAPPVSPEVATKTVTFLGLCSLKYPIQRAIKRAPTSLNAMVGPWKSSRVAVLSLILFTGKSKQRVSATIFSNRASGMVPPTNGRITSTPISTMDFVAIAARKSSFNLGVLSGKYNPLSGASPRITASEKLAVLFLSVRL